MTLLCIGGEHEGMAIDTPKVTHTFPKLAEWEKEETYLRLSVKGGVDFFMLAGMTPASALERWRELTGLKQPA